MCLCPSTCCCSSGTRMGGDKVKSPTGPKPLLLYSVRQQVLWRKWESCYGDENLSNTLYHLCTNRGFQEDEGEYRVPLAQC